MDIKLRFNRIIWTNLIVYSLIHCLVDLVPAGVLFSIPGLKLADEQTFFFLILIYGVLAFGTQPLLGLIIDHFQKPKETALLGLLMISLALFVFHNSVLLFVILVGIGNAIFHIGAGTITLNLTPTKATAPGLYVATGALGLLIGTLLGKAGNFVAWPFSIAVLIGALLIVKLKTPKLDYKKNNIQPDKIKPWLIATILIFTTILLRSLVGTILVFPWKSQIDLLYLLTFGVVMGKAFGGWLADRFGWERIAVGGLLLSTPLLVFAKEIPILAIIGIFLFNFTMPVTLVALSNLLPGRPGFAFGLTCFALFLGSIPAFIGAIPTLAAPINVLIFIMFAAGALYVALPNIKKL